MTKPILKPVDKHQYKTVQPGKVRITATFNGNQAHVTALVAEFLEKLELVADNVEATVMKKTTQESTEWFGKANC